jgi:hypothetical protein
VSVAQAGERRELPAEVGAGRVAPAAAGRLRAPRYREAKRALERLGRELALRNESAAKSLAEGL